MQTTIAVLTAVIDPGQGSQPPNTQGLTKMVGWAAWVVFSLCVVGVLITAGSMAVAVRRGDGGEHVSRIGMVLGAAVLASAASGLVGALV